VILAEVDPDDVEMIVQEPGHCWISEDLLESPAVDAPVCAEIEEDALPVPLSFSEGFRDVFRGIGGWKVHPRRLLDRRKPRKR